MTLDELFNNAKCNTQDAGYEEGHVSHRKDGDFIKQGGSWVPMKGQKQEAGKEEAGADEQTMRQSLINFMTKGLPHVPEADAKKAVEGLPADTLNEMFNNLKEQHGDKYLAQQEAAPEKSKDDAYMDEHGLHDIYMDIKNNELEDYTVEEIAKEYRITKGDAEVIKNRIENNKRAKEQDKQDRKDQAAAGIPEADEKTFVGKTYKDFAESARASGYSPKTEKENPDGSSSTTFKNKEGKSIRVDFDKNGKIQNVEAGAGPTESKGKKLKADVTPTKKAKAFESSLNDLISKSKTVGDLQENLMDVLSQWSRQNEGYLRNRSLDELANMYIDQRNEYYQDEENYVDFSNGIKKATQKNGAAGSSKDAAPKLTGDCKVRLSKIKK